MSAPAIVRHQRLVKLELYPVRYLAASQSIQFLRSATVRIHFSRTPDGSIDLPRVKSAAADPAFEQFYRNSLLNYEQAKAWRVQQEVMQAVVESVSPLQAPFRYKIYLQEDGVYGVSGSELEQAVRLVDHRPQHSGDQQPRFRIANPGRGRQGRPF
jgi:hypothetical protein